MVYLKTSQGEIGTGDFPDHPLRTTVLHQLSIAVQLLAQICSHGQLPPVRRKERRAT